MASGREAALKILYETEQKDGYLNIVFANHMRGSDLPREERALAKELVSGVMQHKITLDYVIRSYSSIRLKKISPYILQSCTHFHLKRSAKLLFFHFIRFILSQLTTFVNDYPYFI